MTSSNFPDPWQVIVETARSLRAQVNALPKTQDAVREQVDDLLTQINALHAVPPSLNHHQSEATVLIDSIKDYAVFALDLEGRITTWNAGAERMFGWTEDEVLGQPGAIIFTPEDQARGAPEAELRQARENNVAEGKRWHLRKDGSRFFANGTVRPLPDSGGNLRGFIKVTRDATVEHERQQAQEALAADLKAMQILHDLSGRLVSENNVQVFYDEILTAAIKLTNADGGSVQILDERTEELVVLASQGFDTFMTTHFRRVDARSHTTCGIALVTGQRAYLDFDDPESEDPDGSLRLHREAGYLSAQSTPLITRAGKSIGMFSTHWRTHRRSTEHELRFLDLLARQAADLIERQRNEAALAVAESRFRIALQKAPITVYTNDRELRYTWIYNPDHGLSSEQMIGRRDDELLAPDVVAELVAFKQEVLTTGISAQRKLMPVVNGQQFAYIVNAEPLRDARGDIQGVTVAVTDVTEIEKARIALAEREGNERQQRLRAEALRDTAAELSSTLKLSEVLERAVAAARQLVTCDAAYSVLIENGTLAYFYGEGLSAEEHQMLQDWHRELETLGDTPLYQSSMKTGQLTTITDSQTARDLLPMHSLRALLVVPLMRQHETLGFLVLIRQQQDGFRREDMTLLQAFAYQLVTAISNANLFLKAQEIAALQERQQFARDLHDAVSQTLFTASLISEALMRLRRYDSLRFPMLIRDINRLIKGAQAEMRSLLQELRPTNLQTTPLRQLIERLIDAVKARKRTEVDLEFEGEPILTAEVHLVVYRIAQEAMNNITRHANAKDVKVRVRGGAGFIELHIRDNGAGFAPNKPSVGMGLQMMRERAGEIGATLGIRSEVGRGTAIHLVWPKGEAPQFGTEIAAGTR